MARNCGNCSYCDTEGEDLICTNSESEYLSDFVDKNHVCVDWEGVEDTEDD